MTDGSETVVPFTGLALDAKARGGKPNPDLIEMLEKALAQAQRGELQCACVVKLFADGDVTHAWATHVAGDARQLLGGMRVLDFEMAHGIVALLVDRS